MFSGLSALVTEDVTDGGDEIVVRARTRDEPAACPGCGGKTSRVHGYHDRTAADVPVDGRRVVVKVKARRLRCPVLACGRQTFREQVPGLLDRYQRRTARLNGQVSATVRELAGRAGSRLLDALGIGVSRHVALRTLLAIRLPGLEVLRVLGIDDFALRKGRVYATVLIDAETGRRVDVLQGRTADVVEDWSASTPESRSSPGTGPGPTARPSARRCRTRSSAGTAGTCGICSARLPRRKSQLTPPAGPREPRSRTASRRRPTSSDGSRSTTCAAKASACSTAPAG